jgi:ribosomal protein S18 acetylase RimI-like enzyme
MRLRPATPGDEAFLTALLISTRPHEAAAMPSPDLAQQVFALQRTAQRSAWLGETDTTECIVEVDGMPAGRLVTRRQATQIVLVDISLMPKHRGAGLGGAAIGALQREAAERAVPLLLHVDVGNRAQRLYERLGFVVTAEDQLRRAMRWDTPHQHQR